MKAPTDKTNDTVQIVVTTRCDRQCSNCTQLLPFRTDVRDMSPDVFRAALRSLEGWPGIRGIFGGNPAIHPQFDELMGILVEEVPDQRQRGLWCNNLRGHGALIREVFYPNARFNLNAHADHQAADEIEAWLPGKIIPTSKDRASWHSPILMYWRDIGLSEEEWVAARENCDINNSWSAGIFERGGQPHVYFCEVAGAIDGMRGVNNGIPAEPGWWRWKMKRFEGQVRNCCDVGCGVPLRRLGHLDTAETYDYTRRFAEWVEPVTSRRRKPIGVIHETMPEPTERVTDYQALRSPKP
jgi:hypothetical protein